VQFGDMEHGGLVGGVKIPIWTESI
jgi:hypothetical protein